jgi:hypothetical protein
MATKSKSGGAGGAMLTAPEGYSPSAGKYYAESVSRKFDTLLPTASVVRLLLLTKKGTADEEVRALIQNPRMSLKRKAPGVYEATVMSKDMDALIAPNTGEGKMFRWVDLAHRCYGVPVAGETDETRVAVAYDGKPSDARKRLTALGVTLEDRKAPEGADESEGEWVDPDAGLYTGTLPGGKIADLILERRVLSLETRPAPQPEEEPAE